MNRFVNKKIRNIFLKLYKRKNFKQNFINIIRNQLKKEVVVFKGGDKYQVVF